MIDPPDEQRRRCEDQPAEDGPERPPRRRRHRRVVSPATTGHPDAGHWTKERTGEGRREIAETDGASGNSRVAGQDSDAGPESPRDRWWREQRPPHWS